MTSPYTLMHKWLDGAYCVGIVETPADQLIAAGSVPEIHWIDTGSDDTWLADPFITSVNDNEITMLVEEYVVAKNKGILSKIKVDRKSYRLLEKTPILILPTHLSFPYPIETGGRTFICPETNATGEAALYEFDNKECKYLNRIISGKMLDTQIVEIPEKGWYAFSVRVAGHGMSDTKVLEIHRAESLSGPYTLVQTIEKQKCEGRGAGPIFCLDDGRFIRPAQNCEGGYGKGVIFYELSMRGSLFTEKEIARINCDESRRNGLCFHTFSPKCGIVAVDGFDYKNRTIARLAPALYHIKDIINRMTRRH